MLVSGYRQASRRIASGLCLPSTVTESPRDVIRGVGRRLLESEVVKYRHFARQNGCNRRASRPGRAGSGGEKG